MNQAGEIRSVFEELVPGPFDPGSVVVAVARPSDWMCWLPEAAGLLSEQERVRVARKHQAADRDALTLCYALHRLFVAAWLGMDATRVALDRDPEGRPRLGDDSLATSLSHARGGMAFALSASGAVGVDLEPSDHDRRVLEIYDRICHESEVADIERLPESARGAEILRIWVRKEAYLKAAGVGLAREMRSFQASAGAILPLNQVPGVSRQVRLHEPVTATGHVLAVAAPVDCAIRMAHLRPHPAPASPRGIRQ